MSGSNCSESDCYYKCKWRSGRTSSSWSWTSSSSSEVIQPQTGNSCYEDEIKSEFSLRSRTTPSPSIAIRDNPNYGICQVDCVCDLNADGWSLGLLLSPSKWEWLRRWKQQQKLNYSFFRKFNYFLILFLTFTTVLTHHPVNSLPLDQTRVSFTSHTTQSQSSECDWTGSGIIASSFSTTNPAPASSSLVQTVSLRCTRGRVHWTQPKGGLRLTITPNVHSPYKLCLDNGGGGRRHRILLEESETESETYGGEGGHRLLPILTKSHANCYRIHNPSAVLYIESHGDVLEEETSPIPRLRVGDEILSNEVEDEGNSQEVDGNAISIAYEVEALRGDGDPCRPCTESEVLQTFCSSDIVARGSILKILPGPNYDSIYINSDLILHQNQPVFKPYENLQDFLASKSSRYDMDKPQRFLASQKNNNNPHDNDENDKKENYGGIVSHPSTCSASVGPGDFLWLIKFRFGIPLLDCVIYWDKWVDIARTQIGECPLTID